MSKNKSSVNEIKYLPKIDIFISSRWVDKVENTKLGDIVNEIEEDLIKHLSKIGVKKWCKNRHVKKVWQDKCRK